MSDNSQKNILDKTEQAQIGNSPASKFMDSRVVTLKENYTIKSTIETFRLHHISGAPVIDSQGKILGVISEYDLLIQAASKSLSSFIEFKTQITAVNPESTLKEVLVILYKQKLKWMPVIDKDKYVKGVISRIDVLNFIASHSDL